MYDGYVELRESSGGTRFYAFIDGTSESDEPPISIKEILELVGQYVVIRDCLALSFAINYDRENGNPDNPQTVLGKLRSQAKTYGKPAFPAVIAAADELSKHCVDALRTLSCYSSASCMVAMPPSDPAKPFDLPRYLVDKISVELDLGNFSEYVRTPKARPSVRETPCHEKLSLIEGTIEVAPDVFKEKIVLLIDDLYQSGVTMNYVAMLLLEAGAKKVFGLACEKTCSNDDYVSRR